MSMKIPCCMCKYPETNILLGNRIRHIGLPKDRQFHLCRACQNRLYDIAAPLSWNFMHLEYSRSLLLRGSNEGITIDIISMSNETLQLTMQPAYCSDANYAIHTVVSYNAGKRLARKLRNQYVLDALTQKVK